MKKSLEEELHEEASKISSLEESYEESETPYEKCVPSYEDL